MVKVTALFATKKFQHTLTWVLVAFTTAICLLYSVLINTAIEQTEDHLIRNYLEREHTRIARLYRSMTESERSTAINNLDTWLSDFSRTMSEGMQVYASDSVKLPAQFKNLSQGVHEFYEEDFYVYVKPLDLNQNNVVLVYDETTISNVDKLVPLLGGILTLLSLVIILASLFIAYFVSRKIAFPIANLSRQLKADSPVTPFDEEPRQDEIGELARTFSRMLTRVNGFLDREKQFTRHASHELRTPASVITNCLNVLKLPNISDQKRQRNLQRIEQSTQTINELIETFLILGREESKLKHRQLVFLQPMILASLEKVETNSLAQKLDLDENVTVQANPVLVAILLDNLIKNACHYGQTDIHIRLKPGQLDIHNDLPESISGACGHGFGQEIVQRIVTELGWRLTKTHQSDQYRVTLMFTKQG